MQCLLTILFACLCLPNLPAHDEEAEKEQKALQGSWEVKKFIIDGFDVPADNRNRTKFVIHGDKLTLTLGEKEPLLLQFTLNPQTKPKSMDLTIQSGPEMGTKMKAIYELKGAVLKVCWADNKEELPRPTDFDAPGGSRRILFELKQPR